MLCTYAGEPFEDIAYECGDGPEFDRTCWFEKKPNLGLAFPNLPYLVDGDLKISQSNAILRHIARKHNLCGKTPEEMANVDMLTDQLVDIRSRIVRAVYHPDFENLKNEHASLLPGLLSGYENFLREGQWAVGDSPTYVDFMIYEIFTEHQDMLPGCLDESPKLKALLQKVRDLPELESYFKSDAASWPYNNKFAYFGGGWRK